MEETGIPVPRRIEMTGGGVLASPPPSARFNARGPVTVTSVTTDTHENPPPPSPLDGQHCEPSSEKER